MSNSEMKEKKPQPVQSYQDLNIWQRAMEIAREVYALTRQFPKEEMFGLTAQMRRAAASIPANIAEGWGRSGSREFQHFLNIAMGSLRELETHLLLSLRLDYLDPQTLQPILENTSILGKQMLTLKRSLEKRSARR